MKKFSRWLSCRRVQRTGRRLSQRTARSKKQPLTSVWAQLKLKRTEWARWQRKENCCPGGYLTWLHWRTGQVPTQHLSTQTGVSVARRRQHLHARVAWHGAETACARFKVQRFCTHLGSAALTTWQEVTKLRNNSFRWTIDGLLCCVRNKVQSRDM